MRIRQRELKKRIYLTIIIISRISSVIYTKEKQKIENMYQLLTTKQHYKEGLIPITINLRDLRQNR